jgi:glycosyltransferase involved in cell wall biosynthesis
MTADAGGGVWTYAMELANGLGAAGVEVHVAIMGTPLSTAQWKQTHDVPRLSIHESPRALAGMDEPWSDEADAAQWLLALEHDLRPDLIHLNGYSYASLPWSAPVLIVGHSCVFSWFGAVKRTTPPVEWEGYRRSIVGGLCAADGVVATTNAMLRALTSHYGNYRSLGCIYHGRDSEQFRSTEKEPFILTSGRLWDDAKNVAALERIAPQLAWPVHIAGDAPPPLGGSVNTGGARKLGRLSPGDMAHWMSRASIFCLPARYEPFGLTALEAALSGCAIVLGDIPSLREMWHGAALFVPPDDPAALRRALERLIENDDERADMAHRARTRALEFSPQRMTDGYLNAYRELVRRSAKSISTVPDGLSLE